MKTIHTAATAAKKDYLNYLYLLSGGKSAAVPESVSESALLALHNGTLDLLNFLTSPTDKKRIPKKSMEEVAALEPILKHLLRHSLPATLTEAHVVLHAAAQPDKAFQSAANLLVKGGVLVLICVNAKQVSNSILKAAKAHFSFLTLLVIKSAPLGISNGVNLNGMTLAVFLYKSEGTVPASISNCDVPIDFRVRVRVIFP